MLAGAAGSRHVKRHSSLLFELEVPCKAPRRTNSGSSCRSIAMDAVADTDLQSDQLQPVEEQIRQKDQQISVLQRKLEHFRLWMSGIQTQAQAKDPQILKNARRLYVGGIPEGTQEEELKVFFEHIMVSTGASISPGFAIASCKISSDKSYAFLEMRSVEEASNAMAFDGVVFQDTNLKIRRPSNYNTADAAALAPSIPDPTVDTSHLPMCKTVVEDSWNKIFIGGLPCNYTDEQVKELLAPYGELRSFNLVMDKNTGKSKGYAFCEFVDPDIIPSVINGLHMQCLERKVLTVKRALEGNRQGGGSQRYTAPPLGSAAAGAAVGKHPSGCLSSSNSSNALQQQQQHGAANNPGGSSMQQQGVGAGLYAKQYAGKQQQGPTKVQGSMGPQGQRHLPDQQQGSGIGHSGVSHGGLGHQGHQGFAGFYMSAAYGGMYHPGDVAAAAPYPGVGVMAPQQQQQHGMGGSGAISRALGSGAVSEQGAGVLSPRSSQAGFNGRTMPQGSASPGQVAAGHEQQQGPAAADVGSPVVNNAAAATAMRTGSGAAGMPFYNQQQQQQGRHAAGPHPVMLNNPRSHHGFTVNPVGQHKAGPLPQYHPAYAAHGVPQHMGHGAPPYHSPQQYLSAQVANHMNNQLGIPPSGTSTPSPHTPGPAGAAAAAHFLAMQQQQQQQLMMPQAQGSEAGTEAAAQPAAAAAALSPVASPLRPTGIECFSPGIGGGAATAAAALAGSHLDALARSANPQPNARANSSAGHNKTVSGPHSGGLGCAAEQVAASISNSGNSSLYHHESMSKANAATAGACNEDSADGSSICTTSVENLALGGHI
eukprot:GHRR01003767.1.p1 GENE.GHRR01003767.1~~GHRR01003767.1.p1  ORF type:complete len:822 (+),score=334.64 GHRR01003767.1:175-2640(+)